MVPNAQRFSGLLYHHDESVGGGHYTVDVLHPNGGSDTGEVWLYINDEAVSPIRHKDVFGTEREDDKRCAYLILSYLLFSHFPIGTSLLAFMFS